MVRSIKHLEYTDFSITKDSILNFHWCNWYKGMIWAYASRINALFRFCPRTAQCDFMGYPLYPERLGWKMRQVGIYNDWLVSIKRDGRYVEIFNLETGERRGILLKNIDNTIYDCRTPILIENKLILFSNKGINVYECNIDNMIVKCVNEMGVGCFEIKEHEEIERLYCCDNLLIGAVGKLGILSERSELLFINLDDGSSETYRIETNDSGVADIISTDNLIFILFNDGGVASYGKEKRELKEFYPTKDVLHKGTYCKMLLVQNKLWIFPATKENILILDLQRKSRDVYERYPPDFVYQFPENHGKFLGFTEDENKFYVGQRSANYMMIIDKNTGKEEWIQIKFPSHFYEEIWLPGIIDDIKSRKKEVVLEEEVKMKDFLNELCFVQKENSNYPAGMGQKIYEIVKLYMK